MHFKHMKILYHLCENLAIKKTKMGKKWSYLVKYEKGLKPENLIKYVVPKGGIEPPWDCSRRILSPVRLPIPPLRHLTCNLD